MRQCCFSVVICQHSAKKGGDFDNCGYRNEMRKRVRVRVRVNSLFCSVQPIHHYGICLSVQNDQAFPRKNAMCSEKCR